MNRGGGKKKTEELIAYTYTQIQAHMQVHMQDNITDQKTLQSCNHALYTPSGNVCLFRVRLKPGVCVSTYSTCVSGEPGHAKPSLVWLWFLAHVCVCAFLTWLGIHAKIERTVSVGRLLFMQQERETFQDCVCVRKENRARVKQRKRGRDTWPDAWLLE